MSEPENFLSRWSRRKQQAKDEPQDDPARAPDASARADVNPEPLTAETEVAVTRTRGNERDADVGSQREEEPAFDLTKLPSLESITAETDIRVFLQKGVPADLTRAALRRAWSADPGIRDFIGIAENQYDFATGSDLPGFGPLQSTDDIRKMVAELFGEGPEVDRVPDQKAGVSKAETTASTEPSKVPPKAEQPGVGQDVATANQDQRGPADPTKQVESSIVQRDKVDIAMQQSNQDSEYGSSPTRRPHGRALPQ
jgi:hypothetical protein